MSGSLVALARAYGVAVDYWDQAGAHVAVDPAVVAEVLIALGADVADEDAIRRSIRERELAPWRRTLPPTVVTIGGRYAQVAVHVPHGTDVRVWIELESGGVIEPTQSNRWVDPIDVDGRLIGEATFVIPADLPLGWHALKALSDDGLAESTLIVTPERLHPPALSDGARLWGFMTQIYSVRSRRSWGVGDLADLADLVAWSGQALGADFTLVNPLHAANLYPPMTPSPYLPTTRRFANPLYLRIEAIPEYAYLDAKDRKAVRRLGKSVRKDRQSLLDRDAAWAAKIDALDIIRTVPLSPGRQALYDAFVAREGEGLIDFATWCAIADAFGGRWRDWPAGLRHPRSSDVIEWRLANSDAVERYLWMQWLIDEQLEATQQASVDVGMRAGVIHDLAVGVTSDGADSWRLQDILAPGVSVGAPPDMYNQLGQDWAQPPWIPDALAEVGYRPYAEMLRTLLRHAGGVRIDHVLGLFRQWWIPRGRAADHGTFVYLDHQALVGILALEAHRAGALVIGEDLGTVEPWVQDALRERGILGTCILWFERWEGGALKLPEDWRSDVLASVSVHDLPPTAGYLRGEHVRIRDDLGLLTRPVEQERAKDSAETNEWLDLARSRGWASDDDSEASLVVALHRLVGVSSARLVGIALPDIVGDIRAQNQPGTDQEYPNWRIPLADGQGRVVLLEDLPQAALIAPLLRAIDATP